MIFFKTQRGQVVLNFIFAFFAGVVILGALFKIRHWPAADEMITIGLLSEVIVFFVMAFMVPPPEEPHWQRYFPDINMHPDLDPNFKPTPLTLPGANGNPALTKFEDMLSAADITPANLGKLGENFKKLGTTVDKMSDVSDAVAATNDYSAKTREATIAISQMKRTPEELVSFVFRECSFPHGCLIMTGTGIVPGSDFTLKSADEIKISIDNIGTLINTVQ